MTQSKVGLIALSSAAVNDVVYVEIIYIVWF